MFNMYLSENFEFYCDIFELSSITMKFIPYFTLFNIVFHIVFNLIPFASKDDRSRY